MTTAVPTTKPVIAVWFSCGAASAVATKLTIQYYGHDHTIRVLNNPVREEGDDNPRFLRDVECWLGIEIERVTNSKFSGASAFEVWEAERGMTYTHGAPCTRALKKQARQQWEKINHVDWHVFGFAVEEKARAERFVLTERANVLPVLISANMTRQDCLEYIIAEGIKPPIHYEQGYPNANCKGCVKATSPTYWNHVRAVDPEIFDARAEQSRRLGARLVRVKNRRIFLDELDPNARGRPMKSLKAPECGIFCEERAV